VAKKNAAMLNQEVLFLRHDFLEERFEGLGTFDIIVSNPPYVAKDAPAAILQALTFEPAMALFPVGEDVTVFYKRIAEEGKDALVPNGAAYLELNEFNAQIIKEIFLQQYWKEVQLKDDLQGQPRMLKCIG